MKFCPECGSDLNGKIICDSCGYDLETRIMPEKESSPNVPIGVASGPIDPAMQYQEHVKTVIEGIKQAHPEMKMIPLEELKQLILDNNFAAWEKISFNGIVPIFGMPTTQLQLFYQKKNVSILSNIFFDDEENDLYSKLILSFDQYKDESMLISKEEKEPDKEFMGLVNPKTCDDTLYCPDCGTSYKKGDVCPKCSGYAE